jgi:quinol monooxygenase YgiN
MSKIQSSARIKIPNGKLEEFKEAVIEYIKQVKEKDTGTLQSDWFLSSDMTECEIREIWESSEAVLKHQSNLRDFSVRFFEKFSTPYSVTIYGDPSTQILENAKAGGIEVYSLLASL